MKNPFVPAFRHPLIISSILILLLNDHVLKHLSPSWFTGKLSDFSGLFFFPFLVALFLFELIRHLRIFDNFNSNQWLLIGFGICAILFSTLKTVPFINHFAINSLGVLLQTPVQIILDPTDLVALGMFLPAWFLWNHIQTDPPAFFSNKQILVPIILAAFASIASTHAVPPPFTDSFFVKDGNLYAYSSSYQGGLIQYIGQNTWIAIDDDSIPIPEYRSHQGEDEKIVCSVLNPHHCFRIRNLPFVEESFDNGKTWSIAWEVPDGRKIIFDRGGKGGQNTIPNDLIFIPNEDRLFVAMVDNGLLVRSPEGNWQQISLNLIREDGLLINESIPTLLYATRISEAFTLYYLDFLILFSISILVVVIYSLIVVFTATSIKDEDDENEINQKSWAKRPSNMLIFISILIEGVFALFFLPKFSPILIFSEFIIYILFFLLIVFIWLINELKSRIIKLTRNDKHFKGSFTVIFVNYIISILIPTIIFNLWALGIIINHQFAWGLTVTFLIFSQVAVILKLRNLVA